jgi:hypothetical protein
MAGSRTVGRDREGLAGGAALVLAGLSAHGGTTGGESDSMAERTWRRIWLFNGQGVRGAVLAVLFMGPKRRKPSTWPSTRAGHRAAPEPPRLGDVSRRHGPVDLHADGGRSFKQNAGEPALGPARPSRPGPRKGCEFPPLRERLNTRSPRRGVARAPSRLPDEGGSLRGPIGPSPLPGGIQTPRAPRVSGGPRLSPLRVIGSTARWTATS